MAAGCFTPLWPPPCCFCPSTSFPLCCPPDALEELAGRQLPKTVALAGQVAVCALRTLRSVFWVHLLAQPRLKHAHAADALNKEQDAVGVGCHTALSGMQQVLRMACMQAGGSMRNATHHQLACEPLLRAGAG